MVCGKFHVFPVADKLRDPINIFQPQCERSDVKKKKKKLLNPTDCMCVVI